jgi:hypothetical protein
MMALAAEAYLAEGHLRRLKSTLNKTKSLNFQFSTWKQLISKMAGQSFEPLDMLSKKEGRQCTYDVTLRRIRLTIVAVEKQ